MRKINQTPALKRSTSIHMPIYYIDPVTNQKASFIHDVPLFASKTTYKMVVEIPRNRNAKLEASMDTKFNPIVQDEKPSEDHPGEVNKRYLKIFPMGNYGFFPQTWEDPNEDLEGFLGDGDPVDVLDLTPASHKPGDINEVEILGALGLIDEGELDWKILAMEKSYYDSLADGYTLQDYIDENPPRWEAVYNWYLVYKTFDEGKEEQEENFYLKNGKIFTVEETHDIIKKCHEHWKHRGNAIA